MPRFFLMPILLNFNNLSSLPIWYYRVRAPFRVLGYSGPSGYTPGFAAGLVLSGGFIP